MSEFPNWRRAFARQAKADLDAYDTLCSVDGVLPCHRLHFLQMACEKLVKAYLCTASPVPTYVFTDHAVIAKHLPRIVDEHYRRRRRGKGMRAAKLASVRHLSRQIELLAPAVDDNGRHPENCEYPWKDLVGRIRCPAVDACTNLNLAGNPDGRLIVKLLPMAIQTLL